MHVADTIVHEVYFRNYAGKPVFRHSSAFVADYVSPWNRADALRNLRRRGFVVLQAQDTDAPACGARRESRAVTLALAAGRALAKGAADAAAYYRKEAAHYRAHTPKASETP